MNKRVDLTITITMPDNHGGGNLSVDSDGTIKIVGNNGNEIIPEFVERATHYERTKGKKYQSKISSSNQQATISGLEELTTLDSFVIVDTNSIEINKVKVSAAFFVVCKLIKDNHKGFLLQSLDNCGHVYEFHNVAGNPELLSIYRIANDTLKSRNIPNNKLVGFVTDTEIAKHESYASGEIPIYLDKKLPSGFKLFYASSDTGNEILNKLLKFCDKESTNYLKRLQNNEIKITGLEKLTEDETVFYRYTYFPSLSITNPIITGTTIIPDTKATFIFES